MKLQEDGYLIYTDKEQIEKDKLFNKQKCFSVIVKKDMRDLDESFFSCSKDPKCTDDMYETNYNKEIDKVMKQVATTYMEDLGHVNFSLPSNISKSEYLLCYSLHYRSHVFFSHFYQKSTVCTYHMVTLWKSCISLPL